MQVSPTAHMDPAGKPLPPNEARPTYANASWCHRSTRAPFDLPAASGAQLQVSWANVAEKSSPCATFMPACTEDFS